jgi:hypothetical protein
MSGSGQTLELIRRTIRQDHNGLANFHFAGSRLARRDEQGPIKPAGEK